MKKLLASAFIFCLSLHSIVLPVFAETSPETLICGITEIEKYGNLVLDLTEDDLTDAGFNYGDLLTVAIENVEYQMPLCSNYSDVEVGEPILRSTPDKVSLALNMGNLAQASGLADQIAAQALQLEQAEVHITLLEKEGYLAQYLLHQLKRTNERADYASDQIFANFRNISMGDLGKNALFRSSSPINNELGRASYADSFMEEYEIKTVVNLADNHELIAGYIAKDDFNSHYYLSLYDAKRVMPLNLGIDFKEESFRTGLAKGLRFMSQKEGPYLVHCTEGKDRAGFTSALLSAFMGASYEEIAADYMQTYINYYHVEKDSEQYAAIQKSNIDVILKTITGAETVAELTTETLTAGAEAYLSSIGLTEEEQAALRKNLSKHYVAADLYSVQPGDSLWKIAKVYYGDGRLWGRIYEANRNLITLPHLIFQNQRLMLPAED